MRNVVKIPLIFILLILIYFLFTTGSSDTNQHQINVTKNQVAQEAIKQYNIVKRNGPGMEASLHAGFVAEAFLKVGDSENHSKWTKIKEQEERNAKNANVNLP
ncbi:hypothetical protein ATE84_3788 [Aquimarina sp. MAR_2010_214]|uniref:hypothetical protein n=1 Tax=Aquimarina sp. MAR_2010_214 TaxID=1250026 RepID=UPI000C7025A1|nr:hypothetical protein [Aquimarina sp. MAR_2010_214]PKV51696.1 hypothetical protein ATE84_3788 [Aquimarina sp. MAR_2010_214]